MQVRRLGILVAIIAICAGGAEKLFAAEKPYTAQLESECDAMIESAVKKPYGWAWDPLASNLEPAKPRAVSMAPGATPAAGLVLRLAGELLKKPTYLDAAEQAARGAIASRDNDGRIASVPLFGDSVTVSPDSSPLPDRAATRAGLALVRIVLPDANARNELTTGATASAKWLAKQQASAGAWPTTPRAIRLDSSDPRDCTIAMLLAADELHDKALTQSASRAIDALLQMRRPDHHSLWIIAYDEKLAPAASALGLPDDTDLLASQYAMQTLLADYLLSGERRIGLALDDAMGHALALRPKAGEWRRFPAESRAPSALQSTGSDSVGAEQLKLDQLADNVKQLKILGRGKYTRMIERHFTVNQQLALCVAGVSDTPLLDLPVTSDEVSDYLQRHEQEWKSLEGAPPTELTARVHRLWLLLIRAKLEQM